jgi:hypothetical protein
MPTQGSNPCLSAHKPKGREKMRYELKRVEIWPIIKVVLIFSLVFGFFIGIFYAFFFSFISRFAAPFHDLSGQDFGSFGGVGILFLVFICTVFITVINIVTATVFTALYNLMATSIGGLVFDLAPQKEETSQDSLPVG